MKQLTFVDFLVGFLRPYKDELFFTTCVMKAMKELGHPIFQESMYQEPVKSCRLDGCGE
jgi:hypothetical protein